MIAQVREHPQTGRPTFIIVTGDSNIGQLIQIDEIEREIQRDERNYKSYLKALANEKEQAMQIAEHDSWYGFIDSIRLPTAKAKALAALNKQVSIQHVLGERGALIKKLVDAGYTVQQESEGTMWSGKKLAAGRVLTSPAGSYFAEKDLTKTGIDFAEYLIHQVA